MTEKKPAPKKTPAKETAEDTKLPPASTERDNSGNSTADTTAENGATADAAVLSPLDGLPIPATQAQADATTSVVADPESAAADEVKGKAVGQPDTEGAVPGGEGEKSEDGPIAARNFRHGFGEGRTVVGERGKPVTGLSAAEARELTGLGHLEAR